MCLISFAYQPGKELVLTANRDEFYARPTATLAQWQDHPSLYGGRDLSQGGSWLAVNNQYELAALTNVRVLNVGPDNPPSRGALISQFLLGQGAILSRLQVMAEQAQHYAPFNLIAGDLHQLYYLSNYPTISLSPISAGTYGLSNAQLDTPWPKLELAKQQLQQWHTTAGDLRQLSQLLSRREPYPDALLPSTGVGLDFERLLSAQFIHSEHYGTRSSSGLVITQTQLRLAETSWDTTGQLQQFKEIII